jgi:hypothetical protein
MSCDARLVTRRLQPTKEIQGDTMRKRPHKKVLEDARRILEELAEDPDTPQLGRIWSGAWVLLMDGNPEAFENSERRQKAKEPRVYWPKELAC